MRTVDHLLGLVRYLNRQHRLTETDATALRHLPHVVKELARDASLVREGDHPSHSAVLLAGYMYRQRIVTRDGSRQILSVHFPGEIVDLQNALLERADHDVHALTRCHVALIPVDALLHLAFARPGVGRALWKASLIDAAIMRQLVASLGRRDARARLAHYLCEFGMRSEMAGLGPRAAFELPLTQDHLADILGLTSIHVNRSLRQLSAEGLVVRAGRAVAIPDFDALASVGAFTEAYLTGGGKGRESSDLALPR